MLRGDVDGPLRVVAIAFFSNISLTASRFIESNTSSRCFFSDWLRRAYRLGYVRRRDSVGIVLATAVFAASSVTATDLVRSSLCFPSAWLRRA